VRNILSSKIKESALSVLPIVTIVLLVNIFIVNVPISYITRFLIGSLSLIIGMTLFNMGADIALIPIGEKTGTYLMKTKKLWLILGISFLLGLIISIAEPDLIVLSKQISTIPSFVFVIIVSLGVGIFFVLSIIRILYQIKMSYFLAIVYGIIIFLIFMVSNYFTSLAFDASGVTTGPISVPLILALGLGFTSLRGDKKANEDSFGIIALCSVGPILVVLLMGLFLPDGGVNYESYTLVNNNIFISYLSALFDNAKSMLLIILPISIFFIVFQIFFLKLRKKTFIKIIKGLGYTYLGLVLFLAGANMGYMPLGYILGKILAALESRWVVVIIGFIIGCALVITEPAVQVLTTQIDKVTQGNISKKAMMIILSLSVAIAVVLSILKIMFGWSMLYIMAGGYLLVVIMLFLTPNVFSAIAFDSGGVAAGTMTVAFLLPFTVGINESLFGCSAGDVFGIIALTVLAPIFAIQLLGIIYNYRMKKMSKHLEPQVTDEIIDYQEEGTYE